METISTEAYEPFCFESTFLALVCRSPSSSSRVRFLDGVLAGEIEVCCDGTVSDGGAVLLGSGCDDCVVSAGAEAGTVSEGAIGVVEVPLDPDAEASSEGAEVLSSGTLLYENSD